MLGVFFFIQAVFTRFLKKLRMYCPT